MICTVAQARGLDLYVLCSVPIHAVGFTKSHEPSPLWLLSNATHGTYVSLTHDWNQLRGESWSRDCAVRSRWY